jgi:hypothetical protein
MDAYFNWFNLDYEEKKFSVAKWLYITAKTKWNKLLKRKLLIIIEKNVSNVMKSGM